MAPVRRAYQIVIGNQYENDVITCECREGQIRARSLHARISVNAMKLNGFGLSLLTANLFIRRLRCALRHG
jgi:hypothetical protein